jgi:hypothetical protein
MHRKAQESFSSLIVITWFIFLIIALMSVVFMVRKYVNYSVDSKPIDAEIFAQDLLLAKGGIIHSDNITGRNYPWVIDQDKFTLEIINKTMSYGSNNYYIAANLSLLDKDGKNIKSVLYNELWYSRWKPRAFSSFGDAVKLNKKKYVLIKQGDRIAPGYILMEIVYPK